MAEVIIPVTPTAVNTWVYGYSKVESGKLVGLGIFPEPQFGDLLLQVGIVQGGRGDDHIVTVFFAGYPSIENQNIWVGEYPLTPYMELFARARYQITTTTYNIMAVIFKDP